MQLLKRAVGIAVAATLFVIAGQAQAKNKDEKLCANLASFKDTVDRLGNLGPQNSVKDLRTLENKAEASGKSIVHEAAMDQHAQGLSSAINDLDRAVNQLPPDMTLSDAQQHIQGQIDEVKTAAQNFEQARCQK